MLIPGRQIQPAKRPPRAPTVRPKTDMLSRGTGK